jgi:hypothetical protein
MFLTYNTQSQLSSNKKQKSMNHLIKTNIKSKEIKKKDEFKYIFQKYKGTVPVDFKLLDPMETLIEYKNRYKKLTTFKKIWRVTESKDLYLWKKNLKNKYWMNALIVNWTFDHDIDKDTVKVKQNNYIELFKNKIYTLHPSFSKNNNLEKTTHIMLQKSTFKTNSIEDGENEWFIAPLETAFTYLLKIFKNTYDTTKIKNSNKLINRTVDAIKLSSLIRLSTGTMREKLFNKLREISTCGRNTFELDWKQQNRYRVTSPTKFNLSN